MFLVSRDTVLGALLYLPYLNFSVVRTIDLENSLSIVRTNVFSDMPIHALSLHLYQYHS